MLVKESFTAVETPLKAEDRRVRTRLLKAENVLSLLLNHRLKTVAVILSSVFLIGVETLENPRVKPWAILDPMRSPLLSDSLSAPTPAALTSVRTSPST